MRKVNDKWDYFSLSVFFTHVRKFFYRRQYFWGNINYREKNIYTQEKWLTHLHSPIQIGIVPSLSPWHHGCVFFEDSITEGFYYRTIRIETWTENFKHDFSCTMFLWEWFCNIIETVHTLAWMLSRKYKEGCKGPNYRMFYIT